MAEIVPRWEWRTFGTRFGPAEARFAALTSTGVQDSDETYLLGGSAVVKVREGLLDIKVLKAVDADGLECWTPVMKAPFPLAAADIDKAYRLADLEPPGFLRDGLSYDAFIAAVRAAGGPLRPVAVHKHRVRYKVGGCTAEVSDVLAEGRPIRTVAIESEDAAAVVAAVAAMGLTGYRNLCYPKGLEQLLDGVMDRYAVIDVGTNSVKLHIAERVDERADGGWRTLVDRAEVTRLGEGLHGGGGIAEQPMQRTADAIAKMAEEARAQQVRAIVAVGTAGLRSARNGAAVIENIRERSGVSVEVISGEEESRLAYLAATAALGLGAGSAAVFDTGGGSTQLTFGHGGQVEERFSVNVGAARFTEQFHLDGVTSEATLQAAKAAIAADLSRLDGRAAPDAVVGMGGATTNLAAVSLGLTIYDPARIQGSKLERDEVDRQIELYRASDAAGRRSIPGLQSGRADVILAGACIVRTVMEKLGCQAITVSDRGLRHGVLQERFG